MTAKNRLDILTLPVAALMPALDAVPDHPSRVHRFCKGTVRAAEVVELALQVNGTPRFVAEDEDDTSPRRLHSPLAVVSASGTTARGLAAQDVHQRSQLSGLGHSQDAETIAENAHFQFTPSLRQAPPSRISALR